MTRYLLRRLVAAGLTLLGVSVVTFLFLRLVPGDAITARLGTSHRLTPNSSSACARCSAWISPSTLQYLELARLAGCAATRATRSARASR